MGTFKATITFVLFTPIATADAIAAEGVRVIGTGVPTTARDGVLAADGVGATSGAGGVSTAGVPTVGTRTGNPEKVEPQPVEPVRASITVRPGLLSKMYSCSGGALPKKFTLARELVANAHAPMLVTLLGIVTLVKSLP